MIHKIKTHLPGDHPWQNQIQYFQTIDSTNNEARRQAADGAPNGTIIIAKQQTAGRGRLGRQFQSPADSGIYASLLIRPECRPEDLMHLTCVTAVAICDAIEQATGFRPGIKWTNDLIADKRKIGGILTELSVNPHSGLIDYAIIGFGINCYQKATDFPDEIKDIATSLFIATGFSHPADKIIACIIAELFHCTQNLATLALSYMARYRNDCVTIGSDIRLVRGDEVRYGYALDVNTDGALIVKMIDGTCEAVNSGEVSVRGMYGYQ